MADENETARAQQEAEMKKHGITPASERQKAGKDSDDDEDVDDDENAEDTESEEEDSADEEEEEETDDDEEDEEDEEEEEGQSHKKKGIPYKIYNEMRSELREANRKIGELMKKDDKKVEDVPEDFSKRVEAVAKEIGVGDATGLKKIMALVDEVMKGKASNLEKKLADLEEKYGKIISSAPIEDGFESEWKTFQKSVFSKEFPDATDEELEAAQGLMNELSHSKKTGGIAYRDDEGRELLNPYPLDYILFKNKSKFTEIMGGKKSHGMEDGRSQNIRTGRETKNENKPLPKNVSPKEIQEYAKRSSRLMGSLDSLGTPIDDSI
jgi:hypothetical protein